MPLVVAVRKTVTTIPAAPGRRQLADQKLQVNAVGARLSAGWPGRSTAEALVPARDDGDNESEGTRQPHQRNRQPLREYLAHASSAHPQAAAHDGRSPLAQRSSNAGGPIAVGEPSTVPLAEWILATATPEGPATGRSSSEVACAPNELKGFRAL